LSNFELKYQCLSILRKFKKALIIQTLELLLFLCVESLEEILVSGLFQVFHPTEKILQKLLQMTYLHPQILQYHIGQLLPNSLSPTQHLEQESQIHKCL